MVNSFLRYPRHVSVLCSTTYISKNHFYKHWEVNRMFRQLSTYPPFKNVYLHSIPGRNESWDEFVYGLKEMSIDVLVNLVPLKEIKYVYPDYYKQISEGSLPTEYKYFPITDYSAPSSDERTEYKEFISSILKLIRNDKRILIHCGAGIGRTGTVAACILLKAGLSLEKSMEIVDLAGSGAEVDEQLELLDWYTDTVKSV